MNESILVPISAAAYKNNYSDMYGAIEIDINTGEKVWQFDAVESELEVAELVQTGSGVEQRGFRPTSVQRLDSGLTLISGWRIALWVDEKGDIYRIETHDHMNDCHEIQKHSDDTYTVASTGMDIILELDEDWDVIQEWKMWEHVDDKVLPDTYYPNKVYGSDARFIAGMPDDRLHLNYATIDSDGNILASALNYGVIVIDRDTGDILWEHTDINECHNPLEYGDKYVVAESGNDRIISVSEEGNIEEMFSGPFNFPKDADYIEDREEWIITDTNNGIIFLASDDNSAKWLTFQLPEKSVPYEADYLSGGNSNA